MSGIESSYNEMQCHQTKIKLGEGGENNFILPTTYFTIKKYTVCSTIKLTRNISNASNFFNTCFFYL
jgi:hypothetical protein